ncbi:hydrogenase nickel incorporation protein HypB [Desulfoluna spongiiphila]|uniref:Hydrogenase nickel incorporation protein HypB n=1 Tax=Desulfoluna spongiiphila TaxID=419481 RepID=A0A1G5JSZ3_9BACT|nr:hydrogenase nickel incorporation protein HypB [Desulfoluna spongiiphila]SCY91515.1 Hydrogenase nickel incorporation protein HypB [Desulfoluna spongiiphila]VVS93043.1 hydrogenase maturation factor hypb [Desulfoluna spongiiphila]
MSDNVRLIEVKENVLDDNDKVAKALRARLKEEKTFLVNLMASPGAGKTSTVIQTTGRLKESLSIGVLEADIDSMVDAEKVAATGITAIQMRTGGFCHLDASMVTDGLSAIGSEDFDLIILENVGNLVCPAEFDTGSAVNVMILSVPEGDDKPLKYPLMFSVCDAVLINKIDTCELFDFDRKRFEEGLRKVNPGCALFDISCRTGEGLDAWTAWLKEQALAHNS